MPPVTARTWRSPLAVSSSQAMTPPTTSPCPPRYLVALCSAIAAPWSSGFWSTGVAKVLSTSTGTSPAAATAARMSSSSSVGLAGVSTTTSAVSGRTVAAISASVHQVTSVPSSPVESRWSEPPYIGRTATTWRLPVSIVRESTAADIAAMPEAKATADSACSSVASAVSKRATVGFHSRW